MSGPMPPEERRYQLEHLHESRTNQMLTFDIICPILIIISLCARVVSRKICGMKLQADDWTMTAACIIVLGTFCVGICFEKLAGFGKHELALTDKEANLSNKLVYIYDVLYNVSYPLIKIAIILFYRRVLPLQRFKNICIGYIVFIALYGLGFTLANALSCMPVQAFWDYSITDFKCVDSDQIYIINAGFNIATDILILVLPIPMVWKLKVPKPQKIALSFIFALGFVTCIVSVIRIYYYLHFNKWDSSYSYVSASIATDIELTLAVLCGNLPTMRPLSHITMYRRMIGDYLVSGGRKIRGESGTGSGYGSYGSRSRSRSGSGYGRRNRSRSGARSFVAVNEPPMLSARPNHEKPIDIEAGEPITSTVTWSVTESQKDSNENVRGSEEPTPAVPAIPDGVTQKSWK